MEIILGAIVGIGLAASAGFRIFVPLLALNLAARFGLFPLQDNWSWMGSDIALVVFAIATIVEVLAYLIPWLDNILDIIATPAAGIAGTLIVISSLANMDPVLSWTLALIAGGGTAVALKGSTSSARAISTVTTGGVANPIMSIFETSMSSLLSVLAIFLPFIALTIVIILFVLLRKMYRKIFSRKTNGIDQVKKVNNDYH